MLFEPDEREIRKKKYIEKIKKIKVEALIAPLRKKLGKLDSGEITPEELFKFAGYVSREGGKIIGDFKKRTEVILAGIAMHENLCMTTVGDIGVSVRKGKVTGVFSDAIINPGSMESGAGALIRKEGGGQIEKEAAGRISGDEAVATGAGKLHCKNIIHVNPADQDKGGATAESIRKALSSALLKAEELELNTIAIPDMAEPEQGLPSEVIVKATVDAIRSHRGEEVTRIVLVSESEDIARMFVDELEVHD
ncbi:MAG: macro domain-containing protein [Candidatus Krumholzibacteriota bacterium]